MTVLEQKKLEQFQVAENHKKLQAQNKEAASAILLSIKLQLSSTTVVRVERTK